MAKYRTSGTALAKILEQCRSLIYIVGEDGRLQFANSACARWLGLELDDLFGAPLVYSSQSLESPLAEKLKGLAPPPELLIPPVAVRTEFGDDQSLVSSSFTLSRRDSEQPLKNSYRKAWGIPLVDADDDDEFSLLVISDVEESPLSNDWNSDEKRHSNSGVATTDQVHQALALIRQQNRAAYQLDLLAGTSRLAFRLQRQVQQTLLSHCDLLITGPAGAGKKHLARALHAHSPIGLTVDLVPIHCSVADRELFVGLELRMRQLAARESLQRETNVANASESKPPGSTSAKLDRSTPIFDVQRSATNRPLPPPHPLRPLRPLLTLLLIRLEQLDRDCQTELKKLIRSSESRIRIFATCQTDLPTLASQGEFDNELAELLTPITIAIPPLCDRLEDLPLIIRSLLEPKPSDAEVAPTNFGSDAGPVGSLNAVQVTGKLNVDVERGPTDHLSLETLEWDVGDASQPKLGKGRVFDKPTLSLLTEFHWPENFQQLCQVVWYASHGAGQRLMTQEDLPKKFHLWLQAQRIGQHEEVSLDLTAFLEQVEKELLTRALTMAQGNKTLAAKLLSLSRAKLLRRLEHFEIAHPLAGDEALPVVADDVVKKLTSKDSARPSAKGDNEIDERGAQKTDVQQTVDTRLDDANQDHAHEGGESEGDNEDDNDWIDPTAFEEVDG